MQEKTNEGIWLMDTETLALTWIGGLPLPKPTLKERIGLSVIYMKSSGKGPAFMDCMKRLAKAAAFCLNPGHVSWSGKPMVTTGLSIDEEWTNFNLTECAAPHSGHGSFESLEDKSSSLV